MISQSTRAKAFPSRLHRALTIAQWPFTVILVWHDTRVQPSRVTRLVRSCDATRLDDQHLESLATT